MLHQGTKEKGEKSQNQFCFSVMRIKFSIHRWMGLQAVHRSTSVSLTLLLCWKREMFSGHLYSLEVLLVDFS